MPAKKKLSQKVDKRHRGRVRIGTAPDGSAVYKYVSGRTKAELEAARKEIEEQYITGSYVQRDVTFGEYAMKWLAAYKSNKSAATYEMYESTLRIHLMPALSNRQLRAIMPTDLQMLLNSKSGSSESLIDKIRLTMKQIFHNATAEYLIDRNPAMALTPPRGSKGERRALTTAESDQSLLVGQEHKKGLLLLLLYYLGVRRGEALGLQWQDIDWSAKVVHIQRDIDFRPDGDDRLKTTASERYIPIPTPLYDRLSAGKKKDGEYIIPGDRLPYMCQSSYRRLWTDLMIEIFKGDPTVEAKPIPEYASSRVKSKSEKTEEKDKIYMSALTAHYYRHNYATMLYAANVPLLTASYWLGHKDIKTTAEIYTHLDKQKVAKDAGLLHDFLKEDGQKRQSSGNHLATIV